MPNHAARQNLQLPIEPSGSIRGQMLKKTLQLQCYLH